MGTWERLIRGCAGLSAVIALGRGLALLDRESIAIGAALLVATSLTLVGHAMVRRLGWLGVAALFVNQGVWMVGATVGLTSAAPSLIGAAVPVVLAVAAIVGLLGSLARVRSVSSHASTRVGIGGLVLAALLTISVPAIGANAVGAEADDLRITTSDLAFEPARLTATAGDVGVIVHNEDLFWHTFTVNKLNANVNVPTGGTKRLELPDLAPGTYEFVCAIPGHEGAGMKGTLVVQ